MDSNNVIKTPDSLKRSASKGDYGRALDILLEAQSYYASMSRFRKDRERNRRYTFGDQWGETVRVDGQEMSEGEYLRKQGCMPLKNNLIRRLVRNVLGVWRSQATEPTCIARDRDEQQLGETMSSTLQYNMQLNEMNELLPRSLEEFLISGLIVHKKTYGWRNDKMDCWTDYVQPNNFFIDSNMRDFRGHDCQFIGEIHDVSFESICSAFATSAAEYRKLAEIYACAADRISLGQVWEDFGYSREQRDSDFLSPRMQGRCRVIEVWRKEQKPRYRCHDYLNGDVFKIDLGDKSELVDAVNAQRMAQAQASGIGVDDTKLITCEWFMDDYWYYYYLTPLGHILLEGETPYAHKSHPYVFKAYPFIDGEVHSFVSDVIDQQRYTNRLITLYDMIMRSSAKGVLMIPKDSLKGTSLREITEAWSKPNGVLTYEPSKSGARPEQVAANSTNIGISELLNVQLKFFEDISGVNGALQGKPGYSSTSGALYAQQTQNATTSLLDILDTFNSFITQGAYKDVRNIQQFYDQRRIINIVGKSAKVIYDPEMVRDVDYDISIVPSTSTPAYRAIANDFLMQIYSTGQITLDEMLEVGNFPFADTLLQKVKARQEAQAQAQAPQPPEGGVSADASAVADGVM